MSDIEWTDRTWNPLVGCSRVSEGCRNCYAERFVHRGLAPQHRGLTIAGDGGKGPRWTGDVRLVEERLGEPLRWRKPARVFVNSLSDLFHESLRFEDIAAIFGVMAAASRHTFQVLTKRPLRAREFFAWVAREGARTDRARLTSLGPVALVATIASDSVGEGMLVGLLERVGTRAFPLPNVWLGVSVEDQRTADERIPVLLELPAALRFVSYEPALGPVDFCFSAFNGADSYQAMAGLDWIIVGGESGPGARPFDVAWARSTIAQCRVAGVACFVKQLGAQAFEEVNHRDGTWSKRPLRLRHRKGADMAEWPKDLRVREMPR